MNFAWKTLPKPLLCLAPMEGVADSVLRRVMVRAGKPDVMFTEFTSVDGLVSRGYEYVADRLVFTLEEKPLIAQIWGTEPDNFYTTAKMLAEKGFDGIDINMGCPDKAVLRTGSGAALVENPDLAERIIQATVNGAGKLPVSVKTRLGWRERKTEPWISYLLQQPIKALTVHLRTAKEMSKVPARWDEMKTIVKLRNQIRPECVLIGNGDILSHREAIEKAQQYGIEGVMIGRGALKNPFIFSKRPDARHQKSEKMELLRYHMEVYEKTWEGKKPFKVLRKFFKIYTKGFTGAVRMRERLMQAESRDDVDQILGQT